MEQPGINVGRPYGTGSPEEPPIRRLDAGWRPPARVEVTGVPGAEPVTVPPRPERQPSVEHVFEDPREKFGLRTPERGEYDERSLSQKIVDADRTVILGPSVGTRFLVRQVLQATAVDLAQSHQDELAVGDPDTPTPPRSVVAVNLSRRPPDAPTNLCLNPNIVNVRDIGVFGAGGMFEGLPPQYRSGVLAAAITNGDGNAQAVQAGVLEAVSHALTERRRNPNTGEPEFMLPDTELITQGVKVFARARQNQHDQQYPEAPDLTKEQIDRVVRVVNAHQSRVTEKVVADLQHGLTQAVLPSPYSAPRELPALTSGAAESTRILVDVTRISVDPDADSVRHKAQVLGAVAGLNSLIVTAGVDDVVVEGAEEIAVADPDQLRRLIADCAAQDPPVRLRMTFTQPHDAIEPYVTGDVNLVRPATVQDADRFTRFLPKNPMRDATGGSSSRTANDGINVGDSVTVGYDPETTKKSGGTSTNRGASGGTSYGETENTQSNVRPPYAREIMDGLQEMEVARWTSDGDFDGVHALRSGGERTGLHLPNMLAPQMDVEEHIDRIEGDMAAERRGQRTATLNLPGQRPQPRPARGSGERKKEDPQNLRRVTAIMQEISRQIYGPQGQDRVDVPLLIDHVIPAWARLDPESARLPRMQARDAWVAFCTRGRVSRRQAERAWDTRVARFDRARR